MKIQDFRGGGCNIQGSNEREKCGFTFKKAPRINLHVYTVMTQNDKTKSGPFETTKFTTVDMNCKCKIKFPH